MPYLLHSALVLSFPFVPALLKKIHDITVQVLIMFFNLLSFLPMDLLSPPTPINTQICFGHYAAVVGVPTAL